MAWAGGGGVFFVRRMESQNGHGRAPTAVEVTGADAGKRIQDTEILRTWGAAVLRPTRWSVGPEVESRGFDRKSGAEAPRSKGLVGGAEITSRSMWSSNGGSTDDADDSFFDS